MSPSVTFLGFAINEGPVKEVPAVLKLPICSTEFTSLVYDNLSVVKGSLVGIEFISFGRFGFI